MTKIRGCVCTLGCEHHRNQPGCSLPPRDNGWCDKCNQTRIEDEKAKALRDDSLDVNVPSVAGAMIPDRSPKK
jgi:hypothetical protein